MIRYITSYFLILTLFTTTSNAQKSIKVAVAASLMPVLKELKIDFETTCDCTVELIPGASGTLANQIKLGAPFDIFISANKYYTDVLENEGLVTKSSEALSRGKLVLWSRIPIDNWDTKESHLALNEFITKHKPKTIAIAQPEIAPYGKASRLVLQRCNNYQTFEKNIIFGSNISMVNQYIYTSSADLVFTSKSSQIVLIKEVGNYWYDLNDIHHNLLIQSAVLIDGKMPETIDFYRYLQGDQSKNIFKAFGYDTL